MAEIRKHTLIIENSKVSISGIESVESLSEKEAYIILSEKKLVLKGENLNANKLNLEEGVLIITCGNIDSINYTSKNRAKLSVGKLFK